MRKGSLLVIIGVVFAAVAFYGVRYVRTPIDTQEVQMTKREESFAGQAYIIRNESVYEAPAAGTVYHYADEGARVSKNSLVSAVYHGQVNEETLQELNNIDKKIEQIEQDQAENELYVSDASTNENRLENIRSEIVEAAFANDISKMTEYKDQINQIQSGEAPSDENTLAMLRQERTQIEGQIGQAKEDIYSQISGIFSTAIDGLEQILTPDTIMEYTVEDFKNIPAPNTGSTTQNIANIGDSICKVADNHVWYVIALVNKKDLEGVQTGTSAEIRFDKIPGVQTPVEVVRIAEEPEGEQAVVVFKSERYSEGVFSIRESEAEIILASYEGFEIPVHAIRVQDGQTGVMVQKGMGEVFKKCEVIYTDSQTETAIVKAVSGEQNLLTIGDRVILGEKTNTPASG